jgi:hypothetical protein
MGWVLQRVAQVLAEHPQKAHQAAYYVNACMTSCGTQSARLANKILGIGASNKPKTTRFHQVSVELSACEHSRVDDDFALVRLAVQNL